MQHLIQEAKKGLADWKQMSVLELIITGLCFLMFFMGYKIGHRDGYLVGRKAVRKYYEAKDQVRV